MSLGFEPELAEAAPMAEAMAHAAPKRRRAHRHVGAELSVPPRRPPIPTERHDRQHHATADNGTQITMRWYARPAPQRGRRCCSSMAAATSSATSTC